MNLVLFVLHDLERLDAVLDAWDSVGVGGVTILPSTGMMRLRNQQNDMPDDLPIFPSLEDFFNRAENTNRTLFAMVPTLEMADRLIAATEQVTGDLDLPNTGIIAVLPVERVKGLFRHVE